MKRITATTLSALLLCSCATGGGMTGSNAGDQAIQGGAIGAVGGYLGCKLLGQSDRTCAKVAIAAGAIGAAIGWKQGKEKDLAAARALEEKARAQNIPVQTETARIEHRDEQGKVESAEAWKGTNVGLPHSLLAKRSPELQQTVELSGEIAATRTESTRILVSTSEADRAVVKGWLANGIARGKNAKQPEIQFVPLAKGKLAFVRVEPTDQAQFKA